MEPSLEFILGLLDRDSPARVSAEDFAGEHGQALRLWQRLGFGSAVPERNPVPSCPHCRAGVPYLLAGRLVCDACLSQVDRQHLLLWRFDLEAFLSWLASALALDGTVRLVDEQLWQLGTLTRDGARYECFCYRSGPLSARGRDRLLAYRSAILLRFLPKLEPIDGFRGPCISLLEVLSLDRRSLRATDMAQLLQGSAALHFDPANGALRGGNRLLGELTMGSKEFHLLACLWEQLDQFVPYADIKQYVLERTGSTDTTDEAGFCQKLKTRMKKRIPQLDGLIETTNKGEGYRLRSSLAGEA